MPTLFVDSSSFRDVQVSGSTLLSGSLVITGSLTVFTGSGIEFQVTNTGTRKGNATTDIHQVTGSLSVTGSTTIFGQMQLPQYNSATAFSGTVTAALNTDANGFIIPTAATLNHQIAAQQAAGSVIRGYNLGCPIITLATNGQSLTSGVGFYTAIYVHTTTTITGVKFQQQTQGVYTANNYNGVGLYTTSGGTLTLVVSSSNDGNIWKGTGNTLQTKAFTNTYSAATGIYYICALYSTSAQTTAPAIAFAGSAAAGTINLGVIDYTNNNKTNGTAGSGLTALAASQAASGITAVQHRYAFYLY